LAPGRILPRYRSLLATRFEDERPSNAPVRYGDLCDRLEGRTKNIRWPHRGDGPEQRFERLCSRLTKLSPSIWYNVEIYIGPDF
jgi:hypothetical protein